MIQVTSKLPTIEYKIPQTLDEMFSVGGSVAGTSAVAGWLSCPERTRLERLGVRRKSHSIDLSIVENEDSSMSRWSIDGLEAREFGTLMHVLLAIRWVYGVDKAFELIGPIEASIHDPFNGSDYSGGIGLGLDDRFKAFHLLKEYDYSWPKEEEPFEVLGVETEVISDVKDINGGPCLRSTKYDMVVRLKADNRIYSLEHKTTSRSGDSSMSSYRLQFAVQCTVWNSNPTLVGSYGPMVGVIPDVLVKTKVPKCERLSPRWINNQYMQRAIEWLRLPDEVRIPKTVYGGYPRFLHSCYGKFGMCEYIPLCWDGEENEFEIKKT